MDRKMLKVAILEHGLEKDYNKARQKSFKEGDRSEIDRLEDIYPSEVLKVVKNLLYGSYKKRERVFNKTKGIVLAGECVFLTLTFTDDVFKRTTAQTRRRYVSRFLKSQASTYVANIDFGKANEREHYHALVYAPRVDYTKWHKYGAIKGERVPKKDIGQAKSLSKYVVKLSLHAIKETAGKGERIIYSRKTDFFLPSWFFLED